MACATVGGKQIAAWWLLLTLRSPAYRANVSVYKFLVAGARL
eukprot:COSAG02_NODE_23315_length_722_cov_1.372392_2_plen_41_part_01